MNKFLKFSLIFFVSIITIWIVGRMTNMLQMFSLASMGNYPTIKKNHRYFTTNLIQPKRFDIICFKYNSPEYGKQIWMFRLCGIEGDVVEIKDGDLYVNNQNVDHQFTLAYNFKMPNEELKKVNNFEDFDELIKGKFNEDSVIVNLPKQYVIENSLNAKRANIPKDEIDNYIFQQYSKHWNQDNFGPIKVPKGKYFVLGDNRNAAQDSRYIGFINESDYVGSIIGH